MATRRKPPANQRKPPVGVHPPPVLARIEVNAPTGTHRERHFTPKELARLWGWGADFIRDQFRDELGVSFCNRPETMRKRVYLTMKIPESVAARVYKRLQNK